MASIIAREASIVLPLVGPDRRFARGKQKKLPIGGRILRGQNTGIVAIENFSIDLNDGDRLGIFGHNGSGKTTLLRALAGIYPPSNGTIDIQGTTAGMFSLTLGVNQEATGLQNIEFKGLMRGMSDQQIEELVAEAAEFSELGDYLHLPVKTYSSGMVMRLMFATASVIRPDILLLDEWVSAGDSAFRKKADHMLDGILENTKIVVIASQNEKRLRTWSNKLVALEAGKTVQLPRAKSTPYKPDSDKVVLYQRHINQLEFEQARQLLPEVWPKDRLPFAHQHQKAILLTRIGQLEEAVEAFKSALEKDPDHAAVHSQLGKLYFRKKCYQQAVNSIQRALVISDGKVGDVIVLKKAQSLAKEEQ